MRTALAIAAAWLALPASSELLEQDEQGFISGHQLEIKASPAQVFDAIVEDIGEWWDPAHTYSGDSSNLGFDDELPVLWEALPEVDGFVTHLRLDFAHPGKTLRLSGGLGPLQALAVAGSMTFELEATEAGTRLTYRYVVNGRKLQAWAEPVDRVMLEQLQRLRRHLEAD